MQLAILLVVVAAVSSGKGPPPTMAELLWRLPLGGILLLISPLAALTARRILSRRLIAGRLDHQAAERHWERWSTAIHMAWTVNSLAILYLVRWPDTVHLLESTCQLPLLDDLLIVMPLVASLILVWSVNYFTEQLLDRCGSPDAGQSFPTWREYLHLSVRHHLGLTLLPTLLILGAQESAVFLGLIRGADDPRALWIWILLLAGAVTALPVALKWLWKARPAADSPLKQRLLESCQQLGCPVREIVVWRTGGRVANAAVAGLVPSLRTIFLSDGLIARLNDDEIDVVVRHEAAHLARSHLWQRLALLGLPLLVYFALSAQWPQGLAELQSMLTAAGIPPVMQASLLVPLVALLYALAAVGRLARMHEHDADLAACTAAAGGSVAIDRNAVGNLHSALFKLVGGSEEYRRRRWLHPSVCERVEFLVRAGDHPRLAPRFRNRVLGISCTLLAACAAALAAGLLPT